MKKSANIIVIMVLVVVSLSIVNVVVANRLSTTGGLLSDMQDKLNSYQRQDNYLKEQILTSSSLTDIASKAATLGFIADTSEVFLSTPLPLALKP